MLSQDDLVFLVGAIGLPLALVAGAIAWRSSARAGRGARDHLVRVLATTLVVVGGLAIALATLFPASGFGGVWFGADINTELFDTVERYAGSTRLPTQIVRDNLFGNVALFVPLGAGVALAARRWGAVAGVVLATVVGGLTSAAVEGLQWVLPLNRSVDIDDLLLNTIGALVGGLGGVLVLSMTGLKRRGTEVPDGYERTI